MIYDPTDIGAEADRFCDRVEAVAIKLAAKDGHDYTTMRGFGEEPIVGPNRDHYDRPAERFVEALDDTRLTLTEVVAVLTPFEYDQ